MKKLLCMVLMLLCASARADVSQAYAARRAVAALYPDGIILAEAIDPDDAFFVVHLCDEDDRLCAFRLTRDGWMLTMDSDAAIRPSGMGDMYAGYRYSRISLLLQEDVLSIQYLGGWDTWQYEFKKDAAGEWQFIRLFIADEVNRIYDELTYKDGCVRQCYTRVYNDGRTEQATPPCPMPWLAPCRTLAGFDASAFPMDLDALSDENLARVAALLLPDYTLLDGKFSTEAITLLMRNPAGNVVFMGGVYQEDGWVWTESTPLPEGTFCDIYHAGAGSMVISFPHPDGRMSRWDEESRVCIDYSITLQADGSWQVEGLFNDDEEHCAYTPYGLYIGLTGPVYGQLDLERDITRIDWSDYVYSIGDALSRLSEDWGVIGEPSLPLYADAAGSALLANYLYGTPVHILAYGPEAPALGKEGSLALVQIADSDVQGWMPVYGLHLGVDQLWEESDEAGNVLLVSIQEDAPLVAVKTGAAYYAAPDGNALPEGDFESWMQVLSDCGNGYLHVSNPDELYSCYVRKEDCEPVE